MAKKKAKRKKPTKSQPKRNRKPFVGDQVLALYQTFGSCCSLTSLTILASIAVGLAFTTDIKKQILSKVQDKDIHTYIANLDPNLGYLFFGLAAALFVFSLVFVRATWLGRKWAIWLHLLLNLPGAIIALNFVPSESKVGICFPLIIAVYCLLRVMGSVGPKL